jgi:hypothetical protein
MIWLEPVPIEETAVPAEPLAGEKPAPFPFRFDSVVDDQAPAVHGLPEKRTVAGNEMAEEEMPLMKPSLLPADLMAVEEIKVNPESFPAGTGPGKIVRKKKTEGIDSAQKDAGETENAGQMELPL